MNTVIKICDELLNCLLFTDNRILFAENGIDLMEITHKFKENSKSWRFKVNVWKTAEEVGVLNTEN